MTAPIIEIEDNIPDDNEVEHTGAYFLLHSNLKIFAKAIHALAKIGAELYLEPSPHGLSLKAYNSSRSAYGIFLFSNDFFSDVDFSQLDNVQSNNRHSKIHMKCALSIFRGIQFLEKNFMSFKMWIDPRADVLIVEIVHAYDLARTLEISCMDNKVAFKSNMEKNKLANLTIASADSVVSLLAMMRSQSEELIITAKEDEFTFKNYCSKDNQESIDKIVKTQATLRLEDLSRHQVNKDTEITFSLKDFMSVLSFAAHHQSPASLYYESPGKPLIVSLEGDVNYTAEFILATYENTYSEADEGGQMEVRIVSDSGNRSRRSEPVHSQTRKASLHPATNSPLAHETKYVRNEPTSTIYQVPEQILSTDAHPETAPDNPYPTPGNSNIEINDSRQKAQSEVVNDTDVFHGVLPPPEHNTYMENLGFNFNPVSQRIDEPEENVEKSPSPKRSRNTEFRRFFLDFGQATQRPTQAFHDDSAIAYDSFDDDI